MFTEMTRGKYWLVALIGGVALAIVAAAFFAVENDIARIVLAIAAFGIALYSWFVVYARFRDIGLAAWLSALIPVVQFAVALLVPVLGIVNLLVWLAIGFVPTGAASRQP